VAPLAAENAGAVFKAMLPDVERAAATSELIAVKRSAANTHAAPVHLHVPLFAAVASFVTMERVTPEGGGVGKSERDA